MSALPPSSDDAWRQMLEYLEGTLPADEVRALGERFKQDAGLRTAFADLLAQEIKLKELGEEAALAAEDAAVLPEAAANIVQLTPLPTEADVPRPAANADPAPRQRGRAFRTSPFRAGLALAASFTLAGLAVWLWSQPAALARLSSLEGELVVERGDRKFTAVAGETLQAGDRLVTSPNSRATFRYLGEDTEVSLEAVTQLKLDLIRDSKRLQLDQGTFEAVVAKQPAGAPLRLATRQADAEVVGTRFKLLTSDATTRLEVFEGAVKILPGTEAGTSLLVPAGKGVTVVPGKAALLQNLAETRGTILLEQWTGPAGVTNQTYLGQFMFSGVGVKPGSSRARGYLHPPRSGAYSFYVAGTGTTELWLSDSDHPSGARKIWSSTGSNPMPAVAQLRTDQRYYIELRCTSEDEPAAFTLSWTTPGGQQRVVYGDYLSPFDPGVTTQ